jgi:endonuclease I
LNSIVTSLVLLVAGLVASSAAAPTNYYSSAEGKSGADLRAALHNIIRGHHVIPYSSTSFDTSDALKVLDQNPTNAAAVILVYSGSNQLASAFGTTTGWNREHLWPQSYGLDGVEPSYSDLFNLRACDATVNSTRGNKYYDFSDTNAPSYNPVASPEAPLCTTDTDSWQPPANERGDIARAMFYMVTRYTGDTTNEPALALTDVPALITTANGNMGRLTTLLAWHAADPVDAAEQLRNDRIYSLYQTNRNPFVDHPEWVNLALAPAHTGAMELQIAQVSPVLTLAWLATNRSTRLEFSTNLATGWLLATNVPRLTNNQFQVTWPATGAQTFFRLQTAP